MFYRFFLSVLMLYKMDQLFTPRSFYIKQQKTKSEKIVKKRAQAGMASGITDLVGKMDKMLIKQKKDSKFLKDSIKDITSKMKKL